jgi:hypothetical protein
MTGFCDGSDEPSCSVRGSLLNISITPVCRMEIRDLIDYLVVNDVMRPFQLPRGLRRGSAAVRLMRLWVCIPPGHGCSSIMSVVCCQVEVSATRRSLFKRSPTDLGASLCV